MNSEDPYEAFREHLLWTKAILTALIQSVDDDSCNCRDLYGEGGHAALTPCSFKGLKSGFA